MKIPFKLKYLSALLVVFISINNGLAQKNKKEKNASTTSEERSVSSPFDKIKIEDGIYVILKPANHFSITTQSKQANQKYISTQINNKKLVIRHKKNYINNAITYVYLTAPKLVSIECESGAYFMNLDTIKTDFLDLKTLDHSRAYITSNTNIVRIENSNESILELKGVSGKLLGTTSYHSNLQAEKLSLNSCIIEGREGSLIYIAPNNTARIDLDMNSHATLTKEPLKKDFNISIGGGIIITDNN